MNIHPTPWQQFREAHDEALSLLRSAVTIHDENEVHQAFGDVVTAALMFAIRSAPGLNDSWTPEAASRVVSRGITDLLDDLAGQRGVGRKPRG